MLLVAPGATRFVAVLSGSIGGCVGDEGSNNC